MEKRPELKTWLAANGETVDSVKEMGEDEFRRWMSKLKRKAKKKPDMLAGLEFVENTARQVFFRKQAIHS
jgi:hypothetical protein